MESKVLNLYFFATEDLITHVGFRMHDSSHMKSESEAFEFLRKNYITDLPLATFGRIPENFFDVNNGITIQKINSMMRKHDLILIFSGLVKEYNLPLDSLHLITPVVNGVIKFDFSLDDEPLTRAHIDKFLGYYYNDSNDDYVTKYCSGDQFDFGQLLKDDHFTAIHLLFNNGHYMSAMKLILSFIDTIAWIDIGEHHNFIKWLNTYSDLHTLSISPEELWEFRNSLLHMTNLDSQKVKQGKVRRISFAVNKRGEFKTKTIGDTTYFNYIDFLFIVEDALKKWVATYNEDRQKIYKFVERYDRIARH